MYSIFILSDESLQFVAAAKNSEAALKKVEEIAGVKLSDEDTYSDTEEAHNGLMYEVQNGTDTYYVANSSDKEAVETWMQSKWLD